MLRILTTTVFANIQANDRFGRYSGEEFLPVLRDMDRDAAGPIVERLRRIVAELDWSAFAVDMAVTISAVIATLAPDDCYDAILARAVCRQGGRANRIASV